MKCETSDTAIITLLVLTWTLDTEFYIIGQVRLWLSPLSYSCLARERDKTPAVFLSRQLYVSEHFSGCESWSYQSSVAHTPVSSAFLGPVISNNSSLLFARSNVLFVVTVLLSFFCRLTILFKVSDCVLCLNVC